jgi:hypothetical protein
MKLRTFKGEWVIFDGEKEITYENGVYALGYMFAMAYVRSIPCTTPALYPVRSLWPHPKKQNITEAVEKRVKEIKTNTPKIYI